MKPETHFKVAHIELQLQRHASYGNNSLRAWDAADEYLLEHLQDQFSGGNLNKIMILNDAFGALSTGFAYINTNQDKSASIITLSDSVVSHTAIQTNAKNNGIEANDIQLVTSYDFDDYLAGSTLDLLVLKIPKSLAQLEDNLRRIRAHIDKNTVVIAAGMTKRVHNSTLSLFEKYIGPTKTSLAKKKARLIFSEVSQDNSQVQYEAEPPKLSEIRSHIGKKSINFTIASYPGVFSYGSLDFGTNFMLDSMQIMDTPNEGSGFHIIDLGCGTGALGIAAAKALPKACVTFIDESYTAIESVKVSLGLSNLSSSEGQYRVLANNLLQGIDNTSVDLVLNNPPFHDATAKTRSIALEMFAESQRVLKPKGQLQVIANKHLGYHKNLKTIFGNCQNLATNSKFVVLRAVK